MEEGQSGEAGYLDQAQHLEDTADTDPAILVAS